MNNKHCSKPDCKQVNPQPLCNFYTQNKKRKDGTKYIYYQPYCKECSKTKSTIWAENNRESFLLSQRKRNKKFAYKLRENGKRRRENGEHKKWQQKNPDKMKGYNQQHRDHDISNEEWENCKNYFNYKCSYCGIHIDDHYVMWKGKLKKIDFAKEHVDDNGENYLSNCIPSCRDCNSHKWKFDFDEWYNENNPVFNVNKLNKIHKWLNEDYKIYIENKVELNIE